MNLSTKTIVFILTSEFNTFKSLKNHVNTFSRFSQHWFNGYTDSNVALVLIIIVVVTTVDDNLDNVTVVRKFTNSLFYR